MKVNERERGATLLIVALVLPVLILMTAFAVDLGRQRSSRRTMQARADIIALDMVRVTDGRTEAAINADPATQTLLIQSASRNDIPLAQIDQPLEWGTWVDGRTPDEFVPTLDTEIPNAVRVTTRETTDYFFQPGDGNVVRSAVASTDGSAGFQVGTRLLSVTADQSLLLNGIFSTALGGPINLTAVGYNGLLGAAIPLGPLATAMTFGSPDELADATVGAQDFYVAAAQVMQNQGNTAAANVLNTIATQTDSSLLLDMGDLMEIEQGGSAAAANGSVDLWSLLTGSVFAINGTHTLSIPAATLNVAGASTTVNLSLIERPRIKFGRVGASVFTQQASIGLTTTITNKAISIPGLTGVSVSGTIPLAVSLVGGTGTLTDINCGAPSISVGLTPQPITITGSANLDVRANLIILGNVPVATAILSSTDISGVAVTGTSSGASFAYPSEFLPTVGTGTMKPAPTNTISLGASLAFTAGHVSLLNAVAIGSGTIATALNNLVLTPVLNAVNSAVISARLDALLGIDIGGGDLGAIDMTCAGVKLVG